MLENKNELLLHRARESICTRLNCAPFSAGISTQYHISKYPTLKLFRGGQIVKKEYRGQRSIDALTEYIKGQLQDTIKKHTTMDELDELEV